MGVVSDGGGVLESGGGGGETVAVAGVVSEEGVVGAAGVRAARKITDGGVLLSVRIVGEEGGVADGGVGGDRSPSTPHRKAINGSIVGGGERGAVESEVGGIGEQTTRGGVRDTVCGEVGVVEGGCN